MEKKSNMLKSDARGVALITSYILIAALVTVGLGFVAAGVNEMKITQRYLDGAKAFWNAEAGLTYAKAQLLNDPTWRPEDPVVGSPPAGGKGDLKGGLGTPAPAETPDYEIEVTEIFDDAGNIAELQIASTGNSGGIYRQVEENMPNIFDVFNNTLSSGNRIYMRGDTTHVKVKGLVRAFGDLTWHGDVADPGVSSTIEFYDMDDKAITSPSPEWDAMFGRDQYYTTLTLGDLDNDTTSDTLNDFMTFAQQLKSDYGERAEIVWVDSSDDVNIYPDNYGCDVLLVLPDDLEEGGDGKINVDVFLDPTNGSKPNFTIISTGKVYHYQTSAGNPDYYTNFIAYDSYRLSNAFTGSGYVRALGFSGYGCKFIECGLGAGESANITGNFIGNNDVVFYDVGDGLLELTYSDEVARTGVLPYGFEYFKGATTIAGKGFDDWQETTQEEALN